jgi:glycerol-3-phosphate acyltransferase PlsY
MIWKLIVIGMAGYLLGSVNLSIVLSKLMGKGDIREHGSGNAGTTNTLRVLGPIPAILVLVFDVLKGFLAIKISHWLMLLGAASIPANDIVISFEYANLVAAFGAIMGHNFPIYYGFKGGKGIATSLGVLLTLEWEIGLICLIFALVLMLSSRMVSLGSIFAAFLYPVLVAVIGDVYGDDLRHKLPYFIFSCCIALLAIVRHRKNITRLLNGTENKLWKTKKEKAEMEAAKAAEAIANEQTNEEAK